MDSIPPARPAFQVFIAYSRKDAAFLDELRTHFAPLERSRRVKVWYDGMIEPGMVWEDAIKDSLHRADVILLLLSADAIASDYFYEKEVSDALERHARGEARVVPLIVRPCAWRATPLAHLQALPRDGKPVSTWADRDDAYSSTVESLLAMMDGIEQQRRQAGEDKQRREDDARKKQEDEYRRRQEAQVAAQAESERQQKLEEQRQKKAAAAAKRREEVKREPKEQPPRQAGEKPQASAAGGNSSSSWVWGGLLGAAALVFTIWICNPAGQQEEPLVSEEQADSLQAAPPDTQQGATKISPKSLPPDVTVGSAAGSPPWEPLMVFVKGGAFQMGCDPERDGSCEDDEKPLREAAVEDFRIGRFEVTQKEWRAVAGGDPPGLRFKPRPENSGGCGQCPVEGVSWDEVQDFLEKLNTQTGKNYRLPTEAEWEFAARGGAKSGGFRYAGGNELGKAAWHASNASQKTHPVGIKEENELGLRDMSGNVREWCQDPWSENYQPAGSSGLERGEQDKRPSRGGAWSSKPPNCRTADRHGASRTYRSGNIGFRLAHD